MTGEEKKSSYEFSDYDAGPQSATGQNFADVGIPDLGRIRRLCKRSKRVDEHGISRKAETFRA